jgi:hypothetical protein
LSFLARNGWQPGCFQRGAKLDPDQHPEGVLLSSVLLEKVEPFCSGRASLKRWSGAPCRHWLRRGARRDRRHGLCAAGSSCCHHRDGPQRAVSRQPAKEFPMSKFAIGEKVDNAADNHEGGTIIAVFPTVEGNFRYAIDTEGYGALRFFNEERLVLHLN